MTENCLPNAVNDRDGQRARQRGESAQCPGGDAEGESPHFQQPVVARRVDVRGRASPDLGKAALDKRPSVALVVPVRGAGEAIEAQRESNAEDEEEGNFLHAG